MSKRGILAIQAGAICAAALLVGCSSSPQAKEAKFLKKGEALLAQKDYTRAQLEFSNAAAAMPKDAEPHYQAGLAYLASGNMAAGVRALQKAVKLNPKYAAAQIKLAELMTTSKTPGVLEDAEKRLQDVLTATPDNVNALDALAAAEVKLGKPEDAAKLLDQALEKYPADLQSAVLLARLKANQKDPAGAEDVMKKAVANAPKSAEAALLLGRFYIQTNKLSQAETEIRRALELDPKNAPALLSLALIQASTNRLGDAEQTYKQLSLLPAKGYQPLYGGFLFGEGKADAALAEFQRLFKANPEDRDARSRLLAAYMTMDKIPQAEALLADALKRNPKDTDALLQRSELRWRVRDIAGATKDLQDVLAFKPDSPEAHYELAKVKDLQGLSLNVRQELSKALLLNPNYLPARVALSWNLVNANDAKSALEILDKTPQAQKNDISVLIKRNWALLAMNNFKEARQEINRGLGIVRDPELLEQDGFLKLREGEFAGARHDAEELLRLYPEHDPENLRAVRLLVDSCRAQHQEHKAAEYLQELIAQRPQSAQLQMLLGRVLAASGNQAQARAAYEAVQAAHPKFLPVKIELARLDLSENRSDSARQLLNTVIAADPRNIAALLMLADAEAAAGLRTAAIARYRAVLDLDNSNVAALNNLAEVMVLNDPDGALKFAEQAVELAPDNAEVQDTMGWVYYRKGIYLRAVEHLKTAVAKESTPRRQYHLAMGYLKSGDQSRGQQILAAALKQDPSVAKTEQGW